MAEYVTVGTTLDALLPTTRLFDDHDAAHDIQLRFTSVPAASLGGAFGVAEAIDELIEYLAQNNDVVAGKSIAIWGPVESMLMWAASYLSDVGEGTLVRQPVFGMPEEGLYSVRETAVGIARDETARLQSASSSLPDRRVGLTLPTYGVLSEAQVFAVRNSPLRVIDGAGLAGPGGIGGDAEFVVEGLFEILDREQRRLTLHVEHVVKQVVFLAGRVEEIEQTLWALEREVVERVLVGFKAKVFETVGQAGVGVLRARFVPSFCVNHFLRPFF